MRKTSSWRTGPDVYKRQQLTLQKEIGGTVYTVTGYYEGKTDFIRKLERMTVDRMRRAMEGDLSLIHICFMRDTPITENGCTRL